MQGMIDRNCEKKAFMKYKFYLSFENSLCEDYLSGESNIRTWKKIENRQYTKLKTHEVKQKGSKD